MQPVVIRRAVVEDLDELVALGREYAAADGHVFDPAIARRGFEPLLADDALGFVLLAVGADDDVAVGYAAVTWGWSIEVGGPDVVLDEIFTRAKGEGVGSRLLAALEATCRDRGVRRIFLETERPNDGARRLYERHGWVADDSIWMAKELT
jgi:GNAT superfamily N-acetyltransferase